MNSKQMTVYKVGFWAKIKDKILSIFAKNKKQQYEQQPIKKETTNSKEEILKIYNDAKLGNVNFNELDQDTLNKILLLLKEEIELVNNKLTDKLKKAEISLNNVKMYNKEIELLTKNS